MPGAPAHVLGQTQARTGPDVLTQPVVRRRLGNGLSLAIAGAAVLGIVAVLMVLSLPNSAPGKPSAVASGLARASSGHVLGSAKGPAREKTGRPAGPPTKAAPSKAATTKAATTKAATTKAATTKAATTKAATSKAAAQARTAAAHSSTASRPAPSPSPPATAAGAASSPAVDLPVPPGFGPLLRQTWVAADPGHVGLTASDVQSTLVGSVYYAAQPAIGDYWAISEFVPTAGAQAESGEPAGSAMLAQFDNVAIFDKVAGGPWAYLGEVAPGTCPATVPLPVTVAWGICNDGS